MVKIYQVAELRLEPLESGLSTYALNHTNYEKVFHLCKEAK